MGATYLGGGVLGSEASEEPQDERQCWSGEELLPYVSVQT